MTKCISCGKDHAMVIEDMITSEKTPIDWCYDCIFSKGYEYNPIMQQLSLEDED